MAKKQNNVTDKYPTLEDLMFNNKDANRRHKKKKAYKKYIDYLQSKNNEDDLRGA